MAGTDDPGDRLFWHRWSQGTIYSRYGMIGGWGEGGPSVSRGDCLWQAQMVRGTGYSGTNGPGGPIMGGDNTELEHAQCSGISYVKGVGVVDKPQAC